MNAVEAIQKLQDGYEYEKGRSAYFNNLAVDRKQEVDRLQAEIERLQEKIQRRDNKITDLMKTNDGLFDTNERYRRALEKVSDHTLQVSFIGSIARDALKGEND